MFICIKQIEPCKKCNCTFIDPRVLPCAETICNDCIDDTEETYKCFFCKQKHTIPKPDGFPKNSPLANLLSKPTIKDARGCENVCEFYNLYEKTQSVLYKLEIQLKDPDFTVEKYYSDLQNQMDLNVEIQIETLQKLHHEMTDKLSELKESKRHNLGELSKIKSQMDPHRQKFNQEFKPLSSHCANVDSLIDQMPNLRELFSQLKAIEEAVDETFRKCCGKFNPANVIISRKNAGVSVEPRQKFKFNSLTTSDRVRCFALKKCFFLLHPPGVLNFYDLDLNILCAKQLDQTICNISLFKPLEMFVMYTYDEMLIWKLTSDRIPVIAHRENHARICCSYFRSPVELFSVESLRNQSLSKNLYVDGYKTQFELNFDVQSIVSVEADDIFLCSEDDYFVHYSLANRRVVNKTAFSDVFGKSFTGAHSIRVFLTFEKNIKIFVYKNILIFFDTVKNSETNRIILRSDCLGCVQANNFLFIVDKLGGCLKSYPNVGQQEALVWFDEEIKKCHLETMPQGILCKLDFSGASRVFLMAFEKLATILQHENSFISF